MSQVFHIQSTSVSNGKSAKRQGRAKSITLWTIQTILALIFLFAGSMKLITPVEMMTASMAVPLPGRFIQFIGVAEVAGALGLILPGLFRIRRSLTPLAAYGLLIIMIGATGTTLITGMLAAAIIPLIVGLLCVAVAYGRRSWN